MALAPHSVVETSGNVLYGVSCRVWNLIRLKKEMLAEFPQLKERRLRVKYRMVFYRDSVELFLAVEKMMDSKEPLPILLFFEQEWTDQPN